MMMLETVRAVDTEHNSDMDLKIPVSTLLCVTSALCMIRVGLGGSGQISLEAAARCPCCSSDVGTPPN